MTESSKIVKAHCNRCLRETRHSVVAAKEEVHEEADDEGNLRYWERTLFEMLECCGCENITLRSSYRWVGDDETVVAYYPPAVNRPQPAWLSKNFFGWRYQDLHSLFREVYAALHAGSNRLAMMGARTIIDMVFLEKIGDAGTFDEKLKEMTAAGHISRTNSDYL